MFVVHKTPTHSKLSLPKLKNSFFGIIFPNFDFVKEKMDELVFSLKPLLMISGGATFPTTTKPIEIQGVFEIRETLVRFGGQTDLPMPSPADAKGLVAFKIPAKPFGHITVKIFHVSIGFSSKTGIFSASIKVSLDGVPKTKQTTVSFGEFAHETENLGAKLEQKLMRLF
jgi:hypothetical protein